MSIVPKWRNPALELALTTPSHPHSFLFLSLYLGVCPKPPYQKSLPHHLIHNKNLIFHSIPLSSPLPSSFHSSHLCPVYVYECIPVSLLTAFSSYKYKLHESKRSCSEFVRYGVYNTRTI